jgi:hypothetical protein
MCVFFQLPAFDLSPLNIRNLISASDYYQLQIESPKNMIKDMKKIKYPSNPFANYLQGAMD